MMGPGDEVESISQQRRQSLERVCSWVSSVNGSERLCHDRLSDLRSEVRRWAEEGLLCAIEWSELEAFVRKLAEHTPHPDNAASGRQSGLQACIAIVWACSDMSLSESDVRAEWIEQPLHCLVNALNAAVTVRREHDESEHAGSRDAQLADALESAASLAEAGRAPQDSVQALIEGCGRALTRSTLHEDVRYCAVSLLEASFANFSELRADVVDVLARSIRESSDVSLHMLALVRCVHIERESLQHLRALAEQLVDDMVANTGGRKAATKQPLGRAVDALLRMCDSPYLPGTLLVLQVIELRIRSHVQGEKRIDSSAYAATVEVTGRIAARLKHFGTRRLHESSSLEQVVGAARKSIRSWLACEASGTNVPEESSGRMQDILSPKLALVDLLRQRNASEAGSKLCSLQRVVGFLLCIWRSASQGQESGAVASAVTSWCSEQHRAMLEQNRRAPLGASRLKDDEQRLLMQIVHSQCQSNYVVQACCDQVVQAFQDGATMTIRGKASRALKEIIRADSSMLQEREAVKVIHLAMSDASATVRRDGVHTMWQCLQNDQSMAKQCLDLVRHRADDTELSVRKETAGVLAELSCLESFPEADEALGLLASLTSDDEATIANDATCRMCHILVPASQHSRSDDESKLSAAVTRLARATGAIAQHRGVCDLPLPRDFPIISFMQKSFVLDVRVSHTPVSFLSTCGAPDEDSNFAPHAQEADAKKRHAKSAHMCGGFTSSWASLLSLTVRRLTEHSEPDGNSLALQNHLMLFHCILRADSNRNCELRASTTPKVTLEALGGLLTTGRQTHFKAHDESDVRVGSSEASSKLSGFACSCILHCISQVLEQHNVLDGALAERLADETKMLLSQRNERTVIRHGCAALSHLSFASERGLAKLAAVAYSQQHQLSVAASESNAAIRPLTVIGYLLQYGSGSLDAIANRDERRWRSAKAWRRTLFSWFEKATSINVQAYSASALLRALIACPETLDCTTNGNPSNERNWFLTITGYAFRKSAPAALKQHSLQTAHQMLLADAERERNREELRKQSSTSDEQLASPWQYKIEGQSALGPKLTASSKDLFALILDEHCEVRLHAAQVAEEMLAQKLIDPLALSSNFVAAALDPTSEAVQRVAVRSLQRMASDSNREIALTSGMRDGFANAFLMFRSAIDTHDAASSSAWSTVARGAKELLSLLETFPRSEHLEHELVGALLKPFEDRIRLDSNGNAQQIPSDTVEEALFHAQLLGEVVARISSSSEAIRTCRAVVDRRLASFDDGTAIQSLEHLLCALRESSHPAGTLLHSARAAKIAIVLARLRKRLGSGFEASFFAPTADLHDDELVQSAEALRERVHLVQQEIDETDVPASAPHDQHPGRRSDRKHIRSSSSSGVKRSHPSRQSGNNKTRRSRSSTNAEATARSDAEKRRRSMKPPLIERHGEKQRDSELTGTDYVDSAERISDDDEDELDDDSLRRSMRQSETSVSSTPRGPHRSP